MYGFSGYGTDAYASQRQTNFFSPVAPIIKLGMRILQNGYNVALYLMLRFRPMTLDNPETDNNTLEL